MIRNPNEISIKDAIHSWIKNHGMENKLNEVKITHMWEELMGNAIASRTTSIKMDSRKLKITVNSAPLKSELLLNRDKIQSRINEQLEEDYIKEVIIL